jgi:sec-independent protein translocase protein TatA
MFGLGTGELLLILIVVVLLFGAKKIPELMRGLGSGMREFKKASMIDEDEKKTTDKTTDK